METIANNIAEGMANKAYYNGVVGKLNLKTLRKKVIEHNKSFKKSKKKKTSTLQSV